MYNHTVYVDTKVLCEIYGISKQAVAQWRKKGLPHEKIGYRTVRYNLQEVQQYFKNNAKKGCK